MHPSISDGVNNCAAAIVCVMSEGLFFYFLYFIAVGVVVLNVSVAAGTLT